ncbi:winged helix-turn-helix transcriptional regulator [Candidatus Pacearchaeota archaeon]|nr:winged helix-turn-helix transcriptional regulator [Candidatus Pacearchaeota archaeon]
MLQRYILEHAHKHGLSENEIYFTYKIFFGTLVSESRLRIINLLRSGEKNVSEIIKELNMNQSNVSHDLFRLKKCGFVLVEAKKQYRYYKLNEKTIRPLMALIDKHMAEYCIHIFRADKETKNGE